MNTATLIKTTASSTINDACQPRLPTPGELAEFHARGFVILRGVVKPTALTAMHDEVLDVVRARNLDQKYLGQSSEYLADGMLDAWNNGGHLQALAEAFLGGPSRLYLPFTAVKGPHQGRFTFHQDNQYTTLRGPTPHIALNIWCALVPMSIANGCLQVVPESHRAGTRVAMDSLACPGHRMITEEPSSWDDCVMEAGDVVIFDRLNVHGSRPNHTDQPRVAYAVQWHRLETEAFFDGTWAALVERPRFATGPVAALTATKQRGE